MAKILAYFNERIIGIVEYCNTGIIEQNVAYTGIINFKFSCFPLRKNKGLLSIDQFLTPLETWFRDKLHKFWKLLKKNQKISRREY